MAGTLSPSRLSIHIAILLILLLSFSAADSSAFSSIPGGIVRRAEAAGTGCSPEGQWNCMTTTWQRCASGIWSVEMRMAAGTRCVPAGFTDKFRVEHDGTVNGESRTGGGGGGVGNGPRRSVSSAVVIALGVMWLFPGVLS
jgi:hypothetical protein